MISAMIISLAVVQFCSIVYLSFELGKVSIDLKFNLKYLYAALSVTDREIAYHAKKNRQYLRNEFKGKETEAYKKAAIAEKFAERAFSLASNATLGVIALNATIPKPRPLTKEQITRNKLAAKKIEEAMFGDEPDDWLHEDLDEAERDILEKVKEHSVKFNGA